MKAMVAILAMIFLISPSAFPDLSPPDFNQLVQAIYFAEGGPRAKHPFGILSVSCEGYGGCRRVAMNTVRNNYQRWLTSDRSLSYLEFLASRYAPVGATNDPKNLNRNWLKNVSYFLEHPKAVR